MNKFYLPVFIFLALFFGIEKSHAQSYFETESNNSFATAGLLKKNNDTLGASIGGADIIDHFIFELDYYYNFNYKSGTIILNVSVTNTGTEESWIKAEVFNGLEAAGLVHSENINGTVAPGATVTKTIRICGLAKDDYFVAMTTNGNFDYKLHWYYSDPNQNDEPNDSKATAFNLSFDTFITSRQSIYYKYRAEIDTVDYFKTTLPPGNYDNINLDILAKNNSCENGKWIMYALYKNENGSPVVTGNIGTPSVPTFTEVFTSVSLEDFQQGDSVFIKIWSNAAFGYELKYSGVSIDFIHEDNDYAYDEYSAESLGLNQLVTGQVGYHVFEDNEYVYDEYNDPLTDNYDNYEITILQDGVLTLNFTARNDDCGNTLYYSLGGQYGFNIDNLDYLEIANWWGTCMEEVSKTDKHFAVMAGTYWISIFNGNSGTPDRMSYSLKYNFTPYNSGGQSDPEPNYSNSVATPINEGDTVKGYMQFISGENDDVDYFQTTLPAESKLRVYLKAIYRGPSEQTSSYNTLAFQSQTNGFYRSIPMAPIVVGGMSLNDQVITPIGNEVTPNFPIIEFLTSDTVFLDTFVINAVPQGTAYFRISSYNAWEYEFRYEIEDSLTGPNDIEPNNSFTEAQPVLPSDTTHGRLRYVVNGVNDIYDYYISETPADGNIKIFIEATHTGTTSLPGADYLVFHAYDGRKVEIQGITVDNNTAVLPGQTVYDTVEICGFAADTIYFRFSGNKKFSYNFRYELTDTVYNNLEPDNNYGQSTIIKGNHVGNGTLGYRKRGITDNNDYYKIFFGSNDSLKLNVSATNTGCNSAGMRMFVYNKNHSQLLSRFISGSNTVAPGDIVNDSFAIAVNAPDTIFVRFESSNPFTYNFSTGPLVPSSFYSIQGDSTVCFGSQVYKAINVSEDDVTYHWSLPSGGGTISYTDSIATINWNQSAIFPVQLVLTNSSGSSTPRIFNVIVNDNTPTQVPVVYNFARNLSTFQIPPGANVQWFRNDILIEGATDSTYYAQLSGTYSVRFRNDCGLGPVSNTMDFPADALTQTINFPAVAPVSMSPELTIPLHATASSGLPVFYQLLGGNGQIINDSLQINNRGSFILKMTQPGDDQYSSAPELIDTIEVIKGDHSIVFDTISSKIYSQGGFFTLNASTTSGSGVSYSIVSGPASIGSSSRLLFKGAGMVTVRAFHNGNYNYNAATPVDQTFCVGVRELDPIAGDPGPCLATYTYTTNKIPGANFEWSLSGGGILQTHNDTAFVTWQTTGTHILSVRANTGCDTIYTNTREFEITTSDNAPAVVSGMVPANNATDQQLPLTLSWIPGANTVSYDLFVWDSAVVQPIVPFASDINTISYVLPMNSFAYNTTYKWKVVSKNPCSQTEGPVQHFRLIPLPDLLVSDIQIPASANSGQTISISWKVTNIGPGRTLTQQKWTDAVLFSFDSVLSLNNGINWNPFSWNTLATPILPLLAGTKPNVQALESGEHYTNSINFTLPQNYSQPIYVFVITDLHKNSVSPLQLSILNDIAEADSAMDVVLTPTADLRVDTVFAPSTAFSGSNINLAYKVKNYGVLTPHGANWKDSVFISQSPLFNRQIAIPLHLKKADDSYYPGAIKAVAGISTQLETDSIYTRNLEVVLPNEIFGTWFIYVQTNADKKLYEGPLSENNINHSQIQVYLTPTPKLFVNTLEVPVSSASITQPFGVNYMVKNDGFKDNIEKNKGHIFTMSTCNLPCSGGGGANSVCELIAPSIQKDSLVFGSSYWVDRIYLSTNPNGLDTSVSTFVKEVKHGVENSGLYPPISYCPASAINSLNIENVIEPNGQYAKSTSFNIPSNLAEGNYYVYVLTNAKKDVFEYPGTMQYKRSAQPVSIQRPDLFISTLNVPASTNGGQPVLLEYTIQNQGSGVFNHIRRDRIYTSIWPVFDANAELVKTITHNENIPAFGSVSHTVEHTFPHSTSGTRYFYVVANFDSSFRESNMINNKSAAAQIAVNAALPNDLVITSISLPDSFFTVYNSMVSYTVKNNGLGTTSGTWTDSLFINCGSVFSKANSYFIGSRIQNRQVAPGESYTDTAWVKTPYTFKMKDCFAESMYTSAYFFIKANADTGAYEASNVNNNLAGSSITPVINPVVDHIFVQTNAEDTVIVGRTFQASYTLRNMGYDPGLNSLYYFRYDGVYLSTDSVMSINAIRAKESYGSYNQLNRFEDEPATKSFTAPVVTTGDYYLLFHTDIGLHISGEILKSNNVSPLRDQNGVARKVHVIRPLLPDLKDSILSAPVSIAVGQPFEIIRVTKNKGLGESFPSPFRNSLVLSVDFNSTNSDKLLSTKSFPGVLAPGAFIQDTLSGIIPMNTVIGNYVLISKADYNDNITESDETNNQGSSLVNIFRPEPADLVISKILHPDTVYLGYTIDTLKYIVNNNAPNAAQGHTKDGIYLSADNLFDSTSTLIGIINKNINMDPVGADTLAVTPLVTGVVEGNYKVLVKADMLNNIVESDKENNTVASAGEIYVKVKELPLHTTEYNTLHDRDRYYKLLIPDSLIGSTIRVRLKSSDSLSMQNEIFIGGGFIPTPAHHDYKFEIPNYGNQQIVMADVSQPVYYIVARSVTPGITIQNIELYAEKLPFSILDVNSSSGGNSGNVTVKISGSLFAPGMTAKLENGSATIYSSAVYFTNSTVAYATFNLQGKPLGVYDVSLSKGDTAFAVLPSGFSVVPTNNGGLITGSGPNTGAGNGNEPGCDPGAPSGLNSQLVAELVVPPKALLGRSILIQIHFSNPTNVDIPAQSRVLYAEEGMKLAFTREGVPAGPTALYIEITEAGGPPGIIRAGGSGTINVYTTAPTVMPNDPKVLFKLK